VILNLLLNASDAMADIAEQQREIVIRTEHAGHDHVRLSVRDVGIGIDPRYADKLFDAFYTTKADGMGIGLSVSRSIIHRHHGHIAATHNDGPGTTVSFSIPRNIPDQLLAYSGNP
jgi:signal transduction histidine kinase